MISRTSDAQYHLMQPISSVRINATILNRCARILVQSSGHPPPSRTHLPTPRPFVHRDIVIHERWEVRGE
jgi:hypothetical protein